MKSAAIMIVVNVIKVVMTIIIADVKLKIVNLNLIIIVIIIAATTAAVEEG